MQTIELTQGKVALVDDEDYAYLSLFNWFALYDKNTDTWYARRALPDKKIISMHRVLVPDALIVDHLDHDGLNNQKHNLRPATRATNARNARKREGAASAYKGVFRNGSGWAAAITENRVRHYLGTFREERDAALAYNDAAVLYFGDFALLNEVPL